MSLGAQRPFYHRRRYRRQLNLILDSVEPKAHGQGWVLKTALNLIKAPATRYRHPKLAFAFGSYCHGAAVSDTFTS
jgi:hypothetical protein